MSMYSIGAMALVPCVIHVASEGERGVGFQRRAQFVALLRQCEVLVLKRFELRAHCVKLRAQRVALLGQRCEPQAARVGFVTHELELGLPSWTDKRAHYSVQRPVVEGNVHGLLPYFRKLFRS